MVPSAFVDIEGLPLTPNGKVDRKALPAPDPSDFRAENAYAEPRTPAEEQLVEIWEEVLGLERVGIHDDFFELGGHSLLATRVVTRLNGKVFGVELPLLLSLFEDPTIAGVGVDRNANASRSGNRYRTDAGSSGAAAGPARFLKSPLRGSERQSEAHRQPVSRETPASGTDAPGARQGAHGRGHPDAPSLFGERPAEGFPALLRPAVDVVQRTGVPGSS